jgi:hypothetical protein
VKAIVLAVAMLVLVGAAFWGGTWFQSSQAPTGPGGVLVGGSDTSGMAPRGNGLMGGITEDQQRELEGMTDEERQQWFAENMPSADGTGQGGPMRGGNAEGEVVEVADDSITIKLDSGSQTFYTDEGTVVAYVEGSGELSAGSTVMVFADPSSNGVTTATLVVVK